ncbi:MAG: alanine racemase, partial [Actinomycetota bacterium]|nr:alanine racemase [Actinomycetota bacterium]
VWGEVDLGAIRQNVTTLIDLAAPAQLCAVVKADGYGHGAVPVARAALEGGASSLAVALVEEGAELRDAGIAEPILLLSEPPHDAMPDVVGLRLIPTLYTLAGLEAAAKAVASASSGSATMALPVHIKVDTGMHRVGARPDEAVQLAVAVTERPELDLQGLWTHFAVADAPDDPFTAEQSARFATVVDELGRRGIRPRYLHAGNSAATIAHPATRHDLVRCGIAVYGVAPSLALHGRAELQPAMTLRAEVSYVKEVAAGEGLSYGLRHRVSGPSVVATVPIGYADGVPWQLGVNGGEVLLGGRRRPIAGSVTMDQILLDCGDGAVRPGDEVVLLGRQGDDEILAWEWAERAGTIAYDVLCGIGARVPRRYLEG